MEPVRKTVKIFANLVFTIVFFVIFFFFVIPVYIAKIFNSIRLTVISNILFVLGKDQIRSAHTEFMDTLLMPVSLTVRAVHKIWGDAPDDTEAASVSLTDGIINYFVGLAVILTILAVVFRNDILGFLNNPFFYSPY